MDNLHLALMAGYPIMAAAIGILYRDYRKCQEARLKESQEHEGTLKELRSLLQSKKGSK